tara:strand:- start:3012 stop:3719 length:708 start_codon:yes stop_codon:yes gene_type:complete
MATVEDRIEQERGCGYRKPGGKYLVSGFNFAPCGKLPMELKACPCCGGGIKQARGFTWIDPSQLFADMICTQSLSNREDRLLRRTLCPLSNDNLPELTKAGLIWVGKAHYSRTQEFVQEAMTMGISRRLAQIPKDLVVGETRVFLAHPEAIQCECTKREDNVLELKCPGPADETCEHCDGDGVLPGVFSSFVPTAIEYVVTGNESEEEADALEARGMSLVRVTQAGAKTAGEAHE